MRRLFAYMAQRANVIVQMNDNGMREPSYPHVWCRHRIDPDFVGRGSSLAAVVRYCCAKHTYIRPAAYGLNEPS
jgi:hypothetical protein